MSEQTLMMTSQASHEKDLALKETFATPFLAVDRATFV